MNSGPHDFLDYWSISTVPGTLILVIKVFKLILYDSNEMVYVEYMSYEQCGVGTSVY